jgi:hypothetical protein
MATQPTQDNYPPGYLHANVTSSETVLSSCLHDLASRRMDLRKLFIQVQLAWCHEIIAGTRKTVKSSEKRFVIYGAATSLI